MRDLQSIWDGTLSRNDRKRLLSAAGQHYKAIVDLEASMDWDKLLRSTQVQLRDVDWLSVVPGLR